MKGDKGNGQTSTPPNRMRTDAQQVVGLVFIVQLAIPYEIDLAQVNNPGDVPYLVPYHRPSRTQGRVEVVYAADGYDLWRNGHLAEPDVSLEVAVQALVQEYRRIKRIYIQKCYRKKFSKDELEVFMNEYDRREAEKGASK